MSDSPAHFTIDELVLISEELSEWLKSQGASNDVRALERWLNGHALPPFGHEDDPYLWILRGLTASEDAPKLEGQLGRLLSSYLRRDIEARARTSPKTVWNALMLSAGLAMPAALCEPLTEIFERRQLRGRWLGRDLRSALELAIAFNQLDDRLHSDWTLLAKGVKHSFLPGDQNAGFEGILLMPESRSTQGQPYLKAIGSALKFIAQSLVRSRKRTIEFGNLLDLVSITYPDVPDLGIKLIMLADQLSWPAWAVDCLNLFQVIEAKGSEQTCVVHKFIVDVLKQGFPYEELGNVCRGRVVRVRLRGSQTVNTVAQIAPLWEEWRQQNIYPDSANGVTVNALAEAELTLSVYDKAAAANLYSMRRKILEKANVIRPAA